MAPSTGVNGGKIQISLEKALRKSVIRRKPTVNIPYEVKTKGTF